jgi:hypothetical protein
VTNLELITDSYREIGVITPFQNPSAEHAALGLRKLNQLMGMLYRETIDLGYFPQTDVNDECPLDDADCNAVMPMLAMSLSVNFPAAEIPPTLPGMAIANRESLLREAVIANAQEASLTNIPLGSARCGTYNINTGE